MFVLIHGRQPDIELLLIVGGIGITIQSILTGSYLQMVSSQMHFQPYIKDTWSLFHPRVRVNRALNAEIVSNLQVYSYYRRRSSDPLIARLGIGWITIVTVLTLIVSNLMQIMAVWYYEQYTACVFIDFVSLSLASVL